MEEPGGFRFGSFEDEELLELSDHEDPNWRPGPEEGDELPESAAEHEGEAPSAAETDGQADASAQERPRLPPRKSAAAAVAAQRGAIGGQAMAEPEVNEEAACLSKGRALEGLAGQLGQLLDLLVEVLGIEHAAVVALSGDPAVLRQMPHDQAQRVAELATSVLFGSPAMGRRVAEYLEAAECHARSRAATD